MKVAHLTTVAATLSPTVAEIRVHLAEVYSAGGRLDEARRELALAVRLDGTLTDRADVKRLRRRLSAGPERR